MGEPPPTGTWASGLISRQHIESLYATAPWDNIVIPVNPISFTMTGWYSDMGHRYLELESTHRQALWESTHAFPISPAQRRSERFMQTFWRQRKQRRSRFGARWKNFLKRILGGMIAGHCDLDILLDPFFLHYPRPHEERVWYPGLGHSNDPADLLEALDMADKRILGTISSVTPIGITLDRSSLVYRTISSLLHHLSTRSVPKSARLL